MTDIIPNAASTADLQAAMAETRKEEITYNGMTLTQLMNHLLRAGKPWQVFTGDRLVIQKTSILLELAQMKSFHENQAKAADAAGDKELAQSWQEDADGLNRTMMQLRGVWMGERDQCYIKYEAPTSDTYLSQLSNESLDVLQHFGSEAPSLLNKYSCAVEDALIEQVKKNQELQAEIAQLKGEPAPEPVDSAPSAPNRFAGLR